LLLPDWECYVYRLQGVPGIFDESVRKIALYDYNTAKSMLDSLRASLEDDTDKSVVFLKAETDYALGRVNILLGDNDKAYDCYNSAYVYYRDLFGDDDPRTLDTKLHLVFLGDKRNRARIISEVEDSDGQQLYKNIAYCMGAEIFTDLDNRKEADAYLNRVDAILKEAYSYEKDVHSSAVLYGESSETSSALGRITLYDQYKEATDAVGGFYMNSGDSDKAIRIFEDRLDLLNENKTDIATDSKGTDLKTEEEKANVLSNLGFLKHYYKGEADENDYLDKALSQYEKIYPPGRHLADINVQIAERYETLGNHNKFYEYLIKARDLVERDAGERNRTTALINLRLAAYHTINGEYDNKNYNGALENQRNALENFKKIYDEEWKYPVNVLYDIGMSYYKMGDYEKAKDWFKHSIIYADNRIEKLSEQSSSQGWRDYLQNCKNDAIRIINTLE